MNVARSAGAEYADVRIGMHREIAPPGVNLALGYGVRARVNGAWSFQHGTLLTDDAVATAARSAAAGAKAAATVNTQFGRLDNTVMIPAPAATGTWESPVEIDPFSVSVDDYQRLRASLGYGAERFGFVHGGGSCVWTVETRVFASTEGALVTQATTRGGIMGDVYASLPENFSDTVSFAVPGFEWKSAGFEAALRPDIAERVAETAEEAIRWRSLPLRRFLDVGRYPVVFDGTVMASVVGQTIGTALDGDRVAGDEIDASGRSFLSPISTIVSSATPAFSPLLTIKTGRSVPSLTAIQWDDDGVAPDAYTLVDRGHVVDYFSTRDTAPLLADWYRQRNMTPHSRGCAVAPTPASIPMACGGEVQVVPADRRATLDELMRDMSHGFLLMGNTQVTASPGLTGGYIRTNLAVEVQRGRPVARLWNLWLAFSTKSLLQKGLTALGDASTSRAAEIITYKGMPWQAVRHPLTAPAASCKEIDVMRTDVNS